MNMRPLPLRAVVLALCAVFLNAPAGMLAADWPQWGGTPGKNMMSEEKGLPDSFEPGEKDVQTGTIKSETAKNVLSVRKVCQKVFSTPVVAGGKVFLCGHEPNGKGIIACLDERTGKLLWEWQGPEHVIPSTTHVKAEDFGICCTPAVDDDRLYVVNYNCEAICLDANGEVDGEGGRKPRVSGPVT